MNSNNNRYRQLFRVIFILIIILLFGCAIWVLSGNTEMKVTLKAQKETYTCGITSINCKLRNISFRTIKYGEPFFVEHFVDGIWIDLNDTEKGINFQLGLKTLKPLSSVEISYPVSAYSSFNVPGDYRIVIQVRTGEDNFALFCPFSVK
jgi:hypothetical protein